MNPGPVMPGERATFVGQRRRVRAKERQFSTSVTQLHFGNSIYREEPEPQRSAIGSAMWSSWISIPTTVSCLSSRTNSLAPTTQGNSVTSSMVLKKNTLARLSGSTSTSPSSGINRGQRERPNGKFSIDGYPSAGSLMFSTQFKSRPGPYRPPERTGCSPEVAAISERALRKTPRYSAGPRGAILIGSADCF